ETKVALEHFRVVATASLRFVVAAHRIERGERDALPVRRPAVAGDAIAARSQLRRLTAVAAKQPDLRLGRGLAGAGAAGSDEGDGLTIGRPLRLGLASLAVGDLVCVGAGRTHDPHV